MSFCYYYYIFVLGNLSKFSKLVGNIIVFHFTLYIYSVYLEVVKRQYQTMDLKAFSNT